LKGSQRVSKELPKEGQKESSGAFRWQQGPGQRRILLHALISSGMILSLFVYWFGVANRYIVFLYELGAGPFDPPTVSRYWMSGLVASGVVLVFYTYGNWVWGRVRGIQGRRYLPPAPAVERDFNEYGLYRSYPSSQAIGAQMGPGTAG